MNKLLRFFRPSHQHTAFSATLLLISAVMLSRVIGYARDAYIAWAYGAGGATDAYVAAFTLPAGAPLSSFIVAPLAYLRPHAIVLEIGIGFLFAIVLPLLCFRHVRSLWLATDVLIRPPVAVEFDAPDASALDASQHDISPR